MPREPASHGTQRNRPASLLRMALPLVVSFSLRFLFQSVDLVYAGFLDTAAVAAIGAWLPFHGVYIALWVGLSAGFTAALGAAFGRRDAARAAALKHSMLRIQAVSVPVLLSGGVALWLLTPSFGFDPELTDAFRTYATTLAIGLPLTGFWSIWPDSIVKAHYDTKSTAIAGILAAGTNLALNSLFVFAFGWGIFGIAFATVVSRVPALLYALARARTHEARRAAEAWPEPASAETRTGAATATILALSVPAGLTYGLTAAEHGLVTGLLASLPDATAALAGFGAYNQLLLLAQMPAVATSVAIVPYVARMVPAGHVEAVIRDLCRMVVLSAAFTLAFAVPAGIVFPDELGAFFLRGDAAEAARSALGRDVFRMLPIAAVAALPFLLFRPVFEAVHRPRLGVLASVLRFAVLSLPLVTAGHAFAGDLGLHPLIAIVLGLIVAAALASGIVMTAGLRTLRAARGR